VNKLMNWRVSKKSIWCVIAVSLVFHLMIVKVQAAYFPLYDQIRTISVFVLLIMLVSHIKIFFRKKNDIILNIIVLLFMLEILYSSHINSNYATSRFYASLQFAAGMAETFFVFEYIQYISRVDLAKKILYYWTLFYCILSDLLFIINPSVYGTADGFLIGNKFQISYLHIILLVFWGMHNEEKLKNRKIATVIHIIWASSIALYTECSTALVGVFIVCVIWLLKNRLLMIMEKWETAIVALAVCDSLLLVNAAVLSNKYVSYFIQNILGKDTTLTGRLRIYAVIQQAVIRNIWFGQGFENNHAATMQTAMAANAQNGILDCMISYGIIGVALLLIIVIFSFIRGKQKSGFSQYAMAYTFIGISMVEITLNREFIFFVAMIAACWKCGELKGESKVLL